jgi:RHS repeat-associated protein
MGFYSTTSTCAYRQKTAPPLKKSRRGFSAVTQNRTRKIGSQVLEPQQEKSPPPTEIASGVHYYGYRYYNPELGRWVNRDPIEGRIGRKRNSRERTKNMRVYSTTFGTLARSESKWSAKKMQAGCLLHSSGKVRFGILCFASMLFGMFLLGKSSLAEPVRLDERQSFGVYGYSCGTSMTTRSASATNGLYMRVTIATNKVVAPGYGEVRIELVNGGKSPIEYDFSRVHCRTFGSRRARNYRWGEVFGHTSVVR